MCLPLLAPIGTALGASAASAAALGTAVTAMTAGSALSAYGSIQQGRTAAAVGRNNQIMAEYAAQDAQRRGEEDAQAVRRKADQLKGTQRATMAARGLDLNAGTAADLLDSTDFFSEVDQNTARYNAKRDAWSSRAQGAQAAAQGRAARQQGNLAAFGTLLGTTGQVADKWYANKGK